MHYQSPKLVQCVNYAFSMWIIQETQIQEVIDVRIARRVSDCALDI